MIYSHLIEMAMIVFNSTICVLQDETVVNKASRVEGLDTSKLPSGRDGYKANEEMAKKTVHSISPSGSTNGAVISNGPKRLSLKAVPISHDTATEFSFNLMALALQTHSQAVPLETDSTLESDIEELLDHLESLGDLSTGDGDPMSRLRWLLQQFHRGRIFVCGMNSSTVDRHANRRFSNAIVASISSLCSRERFDQAVERTSQRAIYQFAYGLSHEINNPLANIAARAQQLIPTASSETDRKSLATIVDQTMRAHEMLSEMMRVVQPRAISPRIEDVVPIIRKSVGVQIETWKHAKIQVDMHLPTKPLYGNVEYASLSEAISSVVQNAMQVGRPNDRIEIICEEVSLDDPEYGQPNPNGSLEQQTKSEHSQINRIRISIRDTGTGMSPEAVERAWDLYYSGREHGRGLGIALANVKRIVDAHHGMVWLHSAPNVGCTVEIRLPSVSKPTTSRKLLSI